MFGELRMEERNVAETIQQIVTSVECASAAIMLPTAMLEDYENDTGKNIDNIASVDLFSMSVTLMTPTFEDDNTFEVLMMSDTARELLTQLAMWLTNMHDAGKCGHEHEG